MKDRCIKWQRRVSDRWRTWSRRRFFSSGSIWDRLRLHRSHRGRAHTARCQATGRLRAVRAIERLPLNTPYPAQVAGVGEIVRAIVSTEAAPYTALIADFTGVARAVSNLLQSARLPCQLALVTITGGDSVTRVERNEYRVPKRDLASAVLVLLQSGRLKIAKELPLAPVLLSELQGFRVKINLSGHDSYGAGEDWRSAPHDDLVLALALACWYGETVPLGPGGFG